ncbi:MAG: hypothetical protein EOP22_03280 [Hyphomicrobiales bacterium]|nr:MAG: hypothetical protein EOP22_03280 [Hyphomicrobiales bacterium]
MSASHHNYLALSNGHLDQVEAIDMGANERALLRALYSTQVVPKRGASRKLYDATRTLSSHCPYCLFGEVYEVDHFLPSSPFPEFSVFPSNLVPICHACNHKKRAKVPADAAHYFLHPYFDALPPVRWLSAAIEYEANGPILRFGVALDAVTHGNLASRLSYHFDELDLDARFSARGAVILAELEDIIETHSGHWSIQDMSDYFKSEADRLYAVHGNSLEAAAYLAASNDDQFCAGNYRN